MINTLQIEGFQSHNSTELELDKGVNVIIGSSDSGKSSVVRACKWLFQNRPQGDSFRNNLLSPKDECSVCAIFGNDSYALRQKMKGTNNYLCDDTEYKALRSDVPQDVQNTTKMKEVNLQSQHPNDQYFLLTESPGQVAKKFNKVAGLAIMDKAIYTINSYVRECNHQSKVYDNEIDVVKQNIKDLSWVKKAAVFADEIMDQKNKYDSLSNKFDSIDSILFTMEDVEDQLKKFVQLDPAFLLLNKLKEQKSIVDSMHIERKTIKELIFNVQNADKKVKAYKSITSASKAIKSIILSQGAIKKEKEQHRILRQILLSIKTLDQDAAIVETSIKKTQKEFDTLLKTEKCPVCGRK